MLCNLTIKSRTALVLPQKCYTAMADLLKGTYWQALNQFELCPHLCKFSSHTLPHDESLIEAIIGHLLHVLQQVLLQKARISHST